MRLAAIVMEIPISCERCPLLDWDLDYIKCKATDRHFNMAECWRSNRVPDCPLIEIPTHGRLIDADAFEERIRIAGGMADEELSDDFKDGVQTALLLLKTQATIIPESV